ncbi:MAG: redox-sensing transcriptional repressor Rex [Eubacterium sp.]|nr:redox-sensing transcriptional repressor Rex [Eubacterium sp.]
MSLIITKATLGRLPVYLEFLKKQKTEYISSTQIARSLELGEVLVRKDLNSVCGLGKPKIGYDREKLIASILDALGVNKNISAVLAGAGQLGTALMEYKGFSEYGVDIKAAFDNDPKKIDHTFANGKKTYSIDSLKEYCESNEIKIGIIAVPQSEAQAVCNKMIECNIRAIWNLTTYSLVIPDNVIVKNENLALSLSFLKTCMLRNEEPDIDSTLRNED